jgi:tetratricopeptide (TPR) repeat protein
MSERALPPIVNAVVQVGVARMRISLGASAAAAYRPRMCLWVDAATGPILHFELGKEMQPDVVLVMHSLEQVARRLGGLPRQIQLRDPEMARNLRSALEPLGVEVVVRESLPMLDQAIDGMMGAPHLGGKPQPGLLDVPGMTADHVIAFAEAAKAFYSARPWQHLIDDDVIAIESPAGPKGTQFTQVLGAAGQTFGLGFVPSLEAHENLRATGELPRGGAWSLTFGNIDSIPFDDGEAWERNNFPKAGPDAYPTFLKFGKSSGYRYPTPDELIWAEGLLRAISQTAEDELDQGKWEKSVQTHNGPATYRFSMPLLLEQMAGSVVIDPTRGIELGRRKLEAMMRTVGQQLAAKGPLNMEDANRFLQSLEGKPIPDVPEPVTNAERAVAMLDKAVESRGRRQVQLAREALKIDPDCVDALLLLAERQSDPEISLPMFRRAVEAGERSLGPEVFKNEVGNFWGILETRPYMRARQHVAMKLAELGRDEESAAELRELLRLNPGDNQGNRYLLIHRLFDIAAYDELETLLDNPEYSETSAEWSFARALLAFRLGGDTAESRQQLQAAMKTNRFVVPLLIGNVGMPPMLPASFSRGSEEEAFIYVDEAAFEWEGTDGAIEWLEEGLEQFKKEARKKARESGKKKETKKRK